MLLLITPHSSSGGAQFCFHSFAPILAPMLDYSILLRTNITYWNVHSFKIHVMFLVLYYTMHKIIQEQHSQALTRCEYCSRHSIKVVLNRRSIGDCIDMWC